MFKNDLTGQRFGMLTVIEFAGSNQYRASMWKCKCDCGNEIIVRGEDIRSGKTQSCGCLRSINHFQTHGESDARLYNIWCGMKKRCNNSNDVSYYNYGGRDILVCDEWDDFVPFMEWANANGYDDNLSIDRIDNDLGYSPDNCRWATRLEQQNNTRSNAYYEYNGEVHSLADWCRMLNLNYNTIRSRLRYGWSFERAISTPLPAHYYE